MMKKYLALALLTLTSQAALASPIYKCKSEAGQFVFQSSPCTADRMADLADTHSSKLFIDEEQRRAKLREQRREEAEALVRLEKKRAEQEQAKYQNVIENPQRKADRERLGGVYDPKRELMLQEIDDKKEFLISLLEDPELRSECSPDLIVDTVTGMSMGAFEDVVGAPLRQQIIGGQNYYYHRVRCRRDLLLQVQYQGSLVRSVSVY